MRQACVRQFGSACRLSEIEIDPRANIICQRYFLVLAKGSTLIDQNLD
jgi:hypothetical protein